MSSQPRPKTIGDQELALLRFVGERGRATVGEAAEGFGGPRGLARSTVLTMMERLRKKGHLTRRAVGGIYHYSPRLAPGVTLSRAVGAFVERTLGGSISPFVAYLAEHPQLTDEEIAELEAALQKLQRGRRRKG
jgi:predicted transcriptional regulator